MDGMIQGGWEYVYAVYGLTWATLFGYMFSIWFRGREEGP